MSIKELYEIYRRQGTFTTDSRDCPKGSLFFALKGGSFDGNKFAVAALEKGCSYAVVDDRELFSNVKDERIILVDDVLQTFKDLAREHRRRFDIPVIGITGTNGKTTTKELVAAVLGSKFNVMCTQGNFNNDVGVPKTLFRLSSEHEIAVVEMGASHPGDIKTLAETAEPTCGLITNVGRAHLQGFGSFEGVKKTKGELYDFLASHGKAAFLNTADADLVQMASERNLDTVAYVKGQVKSCTPFLEVRLDDCTEIATRLIGAYNLANVLAAVTIGRQFGVEDEKIVAALQNYQPSNNRSQLMVTEKNHIVVDAYNANPTSMAAAIENFRAMDVKEPKMAILGEMLELGEASASEHQKIVDLLVASGFDTVWLVGEEFAKTDNPFRVFHDAEEVKKAISETDPKNLYILIKGSNGTKLFQLPSLL
jgi:UDP-N-acetylmuramoyl-tripeptide--D-alanyl-D-alanine ligase